MSKKKAGLPSGAKEQIGSKWRSGAPDGSAHLFFRSFDISKNRTIFWPRHPVDHEIQLTGKSDLGNPEKTNMYNVGLDDPDCNEKDSQPGYFSFTTDDYDKYREWARYPEQNKDAVF